jgi:uncharacterized protein
MGVDPHCIAYKRIFDELNERLNNEMFDEPVPAMASPTFRKPPKPGVMALMRAVAMK